jgi:hypothetical protein
MGLFKIGIIGFIIVFIFLFMIVMSIINSVTKQKSSSNSENQYDNEYVTNNNIIPEDLIYPEQQYIGGRYQFVDNLSAPTQKGYWQDGQFYEWQDSSFKPNFHYYQPSEGGSETRCNRPVTGDLKADYAECKPPVQQFLPLLVSTGNIPQQQGCTLPQAGTSY